MTDETMPAGAPAFKDMQRRVPGEFLTRDQLAEYAGVDHRTISYWQHHAKHRIPFIKLGRRTYFWLPDVDDFLRARGNRAIGPADPAIVEQLRELVRRRVNEQRP